MLKINKSELNNFKNLKTLSAVLTLLTLLAVRGIAQTLEVNNNQPFPVKMPLSVRTSSTQRGDLQTADGKTFQKDGENVTFIVDLPASSVKIFKIKNGAGSRKTDKHLKISQTDDGIEIAYAGKTLEKLSWQILYRDSLPGELKGEPYSTKGDLSADFSPLQMSFARTSEGPVFDVWSGAGESKGLQLTIELKVYHEGFLDITSSLKNVKASKVRDVYAAVVTKREQPNEQSRTVNYDNRLRKFEANDWTNFRVGESRNWYVQRGVDWLKTTFVGNTSSAWMNDFSQSFTVHQDATGKRPARWVGANIPQIGYEAQSKGKDLYILTEIARSNLKSYAERLEDNRLMEIGGSAKYTSRIAFYSNPATDEQVDNAFVAYTSYAQQKISGNKFEYQLGVPYARFGTNYFPYSTLGENFDRLKLPGMDRDAYWPAAPDTVTNWRMFADDIRRDLRIAKTLGFELIRLHHLELIQTVDKKTQLEYLDFFFGELIKLKLKALIDARISADKTAELVKRYRETIDGIEVDNEVLIFGINDDAPAYWKRVYDAVKAVAPEIPVHLTAHTNTGAFDRLNKLGVKFDKIGQHAYSDGLDSQANMRGFSLAAAAYGRKAGKPPIITEWNWRFLTRMTEDDRAKVYAPIFENVLKTRSMPVMYQFQFNESMAMNPAALKGIRHYEQIWLSRRPKPEAFVMSGLINKYGAPTHPNKLVNVEHAVAELDKQGRGTAQYKVTNTSNHNLKLKVSIEVPANLKAAFSDSKSTSLSLKPNETKIVALELEALPTDKSPQPLPGFYHAFLRLEDGEMLRYGWAEARLAGAPQIDSATKSKNTTYGDNAFGFNLNRQLAVVYGDKSPIQDVETAYAIVNTLESATGRPVKVYELKDVPKNERSALILVGTAKTNQMIADVASKIPENLKSKKEFVANITNGGENWLIFSGAEPLDSERAAMDWTVRFWKYAKDSAARRVGLVEKELPLGFDPAALP